MTGIVRKPRPLAHVCLCVGAGGGFFIPKVVPTPPTSVCCLLHSCQEPKSEELNHMMNIAFTCNTYWETCRSRIVTNWLIKADWQY